MPPADWKKGKSFTETVLSIHKKIQKSEALRTNEQVSLSTICKINLLLSPVKVGRLLQVKDLIFRKCTLYRKKQMYIMNWNEKDNTRWLLLALKEPNFKN